MSTMSNIHAILGALHDGEAVTGAELDAVLEYLLYLRKGTTP